MHCQRVLQKLDPYGLASLEVGDKGGTPSLLLLSLSLLVCTMLVVLDPRGNTVH